MLVQLAQVLGSVLGLTFEAVSETWHPWKAWMAEPPLVSTRQTRQSAGLSNALQTVGPSAVAWAFGCSRLNFACLNLNRM